MKIEFRFTLKLIKSMKTYFIVILLALTFTSCKNDEDPKPKYDYDPISFVLSGTDSVIMEGTIDARGIPIFEKMLKDYPNVSVIVMKNVPGSADDISNLKLSRMVRKANLDTHVPAGGFIASGGTDFFIAGVNRSVVDGAKVGVHSWAGGDVEAKDLPKSSPEHTKYIEYYKEMGFSQKMAEDFYFFTIYAAPASSIYYMTQSELVLYGLID